MGIIENIRQGIINTAQSLRDGALNSAKGLYNYANEVKERFVPSQKQTIQDLSEDEFDKLARERGYVKSDKAKPYDYGRMATEGEPQRPDEEDYKFRERVMREDEANRIEGVQWRLKYQLHLYKKDKDLGTQTIFTSIFNSKRTCIAQVYETIQRYENESDMTVIFEGGIFYKITVRGEVEDEAITSV
jgi:hypothetical protein